MISSETIKELAIKNQTTEMNVVREYIQNLFLSYLYQQDRSEHILFKGGTALRLIHESPRFSEDLDFTGSGISAIEIESLIKKTQLEVSREGLDMKITESKKTSGGYLSIVDFTAGEWKSRIIVNISLRTGKVEGDAIMVSNPFIPPYLIFSLPEDQLVLEKVSALLQRGKPRDFFDLYFILRKGLSRKTVISNRNRLLSAIRKIDDRTITRELKHFLPRSFWPVLRNFRDTLTKELGRR
jgi:predicted nucleotidyltransferase component of viral defense system